MLSNLDGANPQDSLRSDQAVHSRTFVETKTTVVAAKCFLALATLSLLIIGWMGGAGKFPASYLSPAILGITCIAIVALARLFLFTHSYLEGEKSLRYAVIASVAFSLIPLIGASAGIAGKLSTRVVSWITVAMLPGSLSALYVATYCPYKLPKHATNDQKGGSMVNNLSNQNREGGGQLPRLSNERSVSASALIVQDPGGERIFEEPPNAFGIEEHDDEKEDPLVVNEQEVVPVQKRQVTIKKGELNKLLTVIINIIAMLYCNIVWRGTGTSATSL